MLGLPQCLGSILSYQRQTRENKNITSTNMPLSSHAQYKADINNVSNHMVLFVNNVHKVHSWDLLVARTPQNYAFLAKSRAQSSSLNFQLQVKPQTLLAVLLIILFIRITNITTFLDPLNPILYMKQQRNLAHAMTAQLSCHVQNSVVIHKTISQQSHVLKYFVFTRSDTVSESCHVVVTWPHSRWECNAKTCTTPVEIKPWKLVPISQTVHDLIIEILWKFLF